MITQETAVLPLDTRIFFDAHKRPVSIALDAVQNFTPYPCSFHFVILLTAKLSNAEDSVINTESSSKNFKEKLMK